MLSHPETESKETGSSKQSWLELVCAGDEALGAAPVALWGFCACRSACLLSLMRSICIFVNNITDIISLWCSLPSKETEPNSCCP